MITDNSCKTLGCTVPCYDGTENPSKKAKERLWDRLLHACARTTEATRRAIQNSQESLRILATKYGVNPKTVAKWKKRDTVVDLPMGPKEARSTVLTKEQKTLIMWPFVNTRCYRWMTAFMH